MHQSTTNLLHGKATMFRAQAEIAYASTGCMRKTWCIRNQELHAQHAWHLLHDIYIFKFNLFYFYRFLYSCYKINIILYIYSIMYLTAMRNTCYTRHKQLHAQPICPTILRCTWQCSPKPQGIPHALIQLAHITQPLW
jgi:hypothetical protein